MGLPEIMEHLQELVDGVAGVDRCHLGMRRFAAPELFIAAGQDPSTTDRDDLHLWFLQCTTRGEDRLGYSGNTRSYQLVLDGFRQVWDPTELAGASEIGTTMTSEIAWSAEVEAICDALRNDADTHGGSLAVGADPPQVTIWDIQTLQVTPEDLGARAEPDDIDCHHATITILIRDEVGVTLV